MDHPSHHNRYLPLALCPQSNILEPYSSLYLPFVPTPSFTLRPRCPYIIWEGEVGYGVRGFLYGRAQFYKGVLHAKGAEAAGEVVWVER